MPPGRLPRFPRVLGTVPRVFTLSRDPTLSYLSAPPPHFLGLWSLGPVPVSLKVPEIRERRKYPETESLITFRIKY